MLGGEMTHLPWETIYRYITNQFVFQAYGRKIIAHRYGKSYYMYSDNSKLSRYTIRFITSNFRKSKVVYKAYRICLATSNER